ncbi:hypothetical protein vseg_019567 [Gypsophila vaccaria]
MRPLYFYVVILVVVVCLQCIVSSGRVHYERARVVRKGERTTVFKSEFGSISTVDIDDGTGRRSSNYHMQFISMQPNSLFLPVLLHADMVLYVKSGRGVISWVEAGEKSDKMNEVNLQRGDFYRLKSNSLFYLNSMNATSFVPDYPLLRIVAIFTNPDEDELQGTFVGPYSSISDIVRGFDEAVLQATFQVPQQVIEDITNSSSTQAIVQSDQQSEKESWEEEMMLVNTMFGIQRLVTQDANSKKKYTKTFNIYKEAPDFENCYGWSKVVTKHDLRVLQGSQIGLYMVNLTKGSMMGPHWNPSATEVVVVLDGEGVVQVVCPSKLTNKHCKNIRVQVEEGDVFTVPRFHPTAQMAFNNGSFVFLGISTTSKKNQPQFLAGKDSVLQSLDESILGVSLNVSNTTAGQLLATRRVQPMLMDCTSCAEDLEVSIEEEQRGKWPKKEEERREEEQGRWEESERGRGKRETSEEEMRRGREKSEEEYEGEESERGRGKRETSEEEMRRGREKSKEEYEEETSRHEEEPGKWPRNSTKLKINTNVGKMES